MIQSVEILSPKPFFVEDFIRYLDLEDLELVCSSETDGMKSYYFYFPEDSSTLFVIDAEPGKSSLCIDGLASWADYKRFPYILDILNQYLRGEHYVLEGKTAFQVFDEEWIADSMGEEIANLKALLSLAEKYYLSLPVVEGTYVTKAILEEHGVCLHSSTPRIYGYIQYLLEFSSLPADEYPEPFPVSLLEEEVDVPQHQPIGKVKSWMQDGSETWESYSREDVDLLLTIAARYLEGDRTIKGVVLNDIGTLYQMGIGVQLSGAQAAYWFREGYLQGDHWFSPTNLGDMYRKGCGEEQPNLQKAYDAYLLSDDPYAWYRIGQAWEEEWKPGCHDMTKALEWYVKAAEAGHHLAIKALERLQ